MTSTVHRNFTSRPTYQKTAETPVIIEWTKDTKMFFHRQAECCAALGVNHFETILENTWKHPAEIRVTPIPKRVSPDRVFGIMPLLTA